MTDFRKLLLACGSLIALGLDADTAHATCPGTIVNGQTVVVTQNLANGENCTIDAGGAAMTGANTAIEALAGNNTIINNGTISITGFNNAIDIGNNNTVINNGTIMATGNGGEAIGDGGLADGNTIINNGTITTTGVSSNGTELDNNNLVINNGTIATTGASSDGIQLDNNNTVINRGRISIVGAEGIDVEDNNIIINSGTITTNDAPRNGIEFGANNTTINGGRVISILGAGLRSFGGNNTIINSGLISGGVNSIRLSGGSNTLTLLPGSVLIGPIMLAGNTDTLNVGNGLSIANTFTGGVPMVGNTFGAPFVVAGNQIAVVDPTTLAVQDESFADLTGGIFSTLRGRMSGFRNGVAGVTANPRPMHISSVNDGGAVATAREYWVQAFGSYRSQDGDGPSLDTDLHVAGFISGVDAQASATTRVGFFLGGSYGQVENVLETQESETDSVFGGVYASHLSGRTAVDVALTLGWSDYDRERQVANNLAAGGLQRAQADFDGFFIAPEISFTRPFWPLGQRIEKVVTLRYAGLFLDSFTETGAADAFSVNDRDIHLGVARAALALPVERTSDDGGHSRLTLTGGIEGRTQFGDETLTGTLLAQNITFDPGGDDGVFAGFATITGEHTTPGGLTAFMSLEGKVEDDGSHQASARGGIRVRF